MHGQVTISVGTLYAIGEMLFAAVVAVVIVLAMEQYDRAQKKKKGRGPWSK